jgi:hypothetical protein
VQTNAITTSRCWIPGLLSDRPADAGSSWRPRNFGPFLSKDDDPKTNSENLVRPGLSARSDSTFHSSLRIGETAYVYVHANKLWNNSEIDVVWGQRYSFRVPQGERWLGRRRTCNANGYSSAGLIRSLESLRRIPEARWLELIGAIGCSTKSAIRIGQGLSNLLVLFSGRLYFFANDLPWMYWNNKGMLAVRITRLQ